MRFILLQIVALPLLAATYSVGGLVDYALQNDNSLKADKEVIQQLLYQKESVRSWDNPELSLSYASTKPEAIERQGEYGISLIQSIQKPALRSAKQRILDARIIQHKALISQKENEISGNIRQKAYLYSLALLMSEKANETLSLATTLREKGEKRLEHGTISKADLLKIKVEEKKIIQESKIALMKLESAKYSLALSARLSGEFKISAITLPAPAPHDKTTVLDNLPMLSYYRAASHEYYAEKDVANESVIPGVKASLGYQQMFDQKSVIASLSVPIPLFHQNEPLIKNAQSKLAENSLREEAYRYEIMQKLTHYQQTLRSLSSLIESQNGVITQAKEMESMAQKSYNEGYGTLLELIDARRVLLINQKELYSTLENYYNTLGEVQKIIPSTEEKS